MSAFVTYRGFVYPWHCDHLGHMNTMWYAGKFDEASWNLLLQLGVTPSYLRDVGCNMAAVEQDTTFKRELVAGDVVEVKSRVLEIGEKVIRFVHAMHHAETGELAATCAVTGVHIDVAQRKACPFPAPMRAAAERLAGLQPAWEEGNHHPAPLAHLAKALAMS
jgi:acyl-CoA thioester hydrolase